MSDATNPTKPGSATSEYRMSMLVIVLGAILSGATVTLGILVDNFPDVGWLGLAAGAAKVAAGVLGYDKSRGQVKAAQILAGTPPATLAPPNP